MLDGVLTYFDAPPGPVWRLVSVLGMLSLVIAYMVNQRGGTRADSTRYLGANAVGAGILAAYSVAIGEWVFFGLEGFWCAASIQGLLRRPASRQLEVASGSDSTSSGDPAHSGRDPVQSPPGVSERHPS